MCMSRSASQQLMSLPSIWPQMHAASTIQADDQKIGPLEMTKHVPQGKTAMPGCNIGLCASLRLSIGSWHLVSEKLSLLCLQHKKTWPWRVQHLDKAALRAPA